MRNAVLKALLLALLAGAGPALFAQENGDAPARSRGRGWDVEVSFTFARQSGAASNQFAVWVEDAQGRYVRTLYATR